MAGDQDGHPHPDGRQWCAAEARAQLLRQRPPLRGSRREGGVSHGEWCQLTAHLFHSHMSFAEQIATIPPSSNKISGRSV